MKKRYAVIGNPIAHSLSPQMHAAWIKEAGFDASYERLLYDGSEENFRAWFRRQELSGANVTVPWKSAALRAADSAPAGLEEANVLSLDADGRWLASNTDGAGFLAALDEAAPSWRRRVRTIAIIGAGGAAAGIATALSGAIDAEIVLVNRNMDRASALARRLPKARGCAWPALAEAAAAADLIVQTTTLGMAGQPTGAPWPLDSVQEGAIAVDIVYRPLETAFLAAARARGLLCVDGLGMLIHQGALAFEIWFSRKPDTRLARRVLLKELGAAAE